ncbi:MAG: HEPN domain-containing protein [Firmicutes bacterium]|nr:HEPN domain-containing protein [Bacillota bacterium]
MKPEVRVLAEYRMERAKESFEEGSTLLETGGLTGAVNRFYYAAFYAARALLALKQLDSSKHSGVISLFQRHFVKDRLIDAQVSKVLPSAFEKRQDTDYEDFVTVTRADVSSLKEDVRRFIEECERVLNKLVGNEEELT